MMATILLVASDTEAALRILGLLESCRPLIGDSGYNQAIIEGKLRPDLLHSSRVRLLNLFVAQPQTFYTPPSRAVAASRPSYLANLHPLASPDAAASLRLRFVNATSLSMGIAAVPESVYDIIVWTSVTSPVYWLPLWVLLLWRRQASSPLTCLMFGVTFVSYALVSSVFGGGFIGLARHSVGVLVGLGLCLAAFSGSWWPCRSHR